MMSALRTLLMGRFMVPERKVLLVHIRFLESCDPLCDVQVATGAHRRAALRLIWESLLILPTHYPCQSLLPLSCERLYASAYAH